VEDVVGLMNGSYDIHTRFDYTFQHPGYHNQLRDDAFAKQCVKKPALAKVAVKAPSEAKV
jgi:acetate kinase